MNGINGYLVYTPLDWSQYLGRLLDSRATRIEMGLAGRKSAEREFSIHKLAPIFFELT
jgi:glycosyltransferase involved in cell wall biosynthesis